MVDKKLTGYDLSRAWFNYLWDHPGEVTSNDTALFFWLVEIWNRIGQPVNFQITAKECKDGMSAKSYNTYKKSVLKLIKVGCLKMIKQSTNQYQCNVVALSNFDTSHDKALNKAFNKARAKAHETFIKPLTLNQEPQTLKANIGETSSPSPDKSVLSKKEKRKNLAPKKEKTVHVICRDVYQGWCKENDKIFDWGGLQGKSLNWIIIKIQRGYREKFNAEATEDKIKEGFALIMQNLPDWYKLNDFSLATINSKYSAIISQIKNGKQPAYKSKEQLAYEQTTDQQRRVREGTL